MKPTIKAICALLLLSALHAFGKNAMLAVGSVAPDFTLISDKGDTVSLANFRNKQNVVLVFYPGDETPVCTQQLCEIRDTYTQFSDKNAVVLGINPADAASHQKFSQNHSFQMPLLIDIKKEVAKKYSTDASLMQKRTVYVIDTKGTIVYAQRGKPPVAEILASIPTGKVEP